MNDTTNPGWPFKGPYRAEEGRVLSAGGYEVAKGHWLDMPELARQLNHIESQASVIATLENRLNLLAVDRGRLERLEAFVEAVKEAQVLSEGGHGYDYFPRQLDEALRELEAK